MLGLACGSRELTVATSMFARRYDRSFRRLTHGLPPREIPLFRAMRSALLCSGSPSFVEEYHGGGHQVTFQGNGTYARRASRCELSDLMIVVYSPVFMEARLTYLQAKSERNAVGVPQNHAFSATPEQWYLLSHRPVVSGVRSFHPPPDILSSAILPSVGSFGFFFKSGDSYEIYYSSADYLQPLGTVNPRRGKLVRGTTYLGTRRVPIRECIAASGNATFAHCLYQMTIGTPIGPHHQAAQGTRLWLAATLRGMWSTEEVRQREFTLARELADLLEPDGDSARIGSFGAKSLVLIRNSDEP